MAVLIGTSGLGANAAAFGRYAARSMRAAASTPLYLLIAAEFVVSTVLAIAFGFRAVSPLTFLPALWCVLLVGSAPLARRIDKPRLAVSLETVGLLYGQGFALGPLLYPLTAIARPFVDDALAHADMLLGFDWPRFVLMFQDMPVLLVTRGIYFSFGWQGAVVLPILCLTGQQRRAWTAVLAANIGLLLTLLIYPLFPAEGGLIHFNIPPEKFENINAVGYIYGSAIHAIRDEGARLITLKLMVPFVSFPSYHAAGAAIFVWSSWTTKLRWPFLVLNVLMVASAIVIGGHYLVDLLAGCAISAVVILGVGRLDLAGRDAPGIAGVHRARSGSREGAIAVRV